PAPTTEIYTLSLHDALPIFHDAALVSMDPKTGEILAMVGGNDYNRPGGQINMANSPRQPGSSFKIFTYSAAIESRKVNMISPILDRKSTRLNSSHVAISYAV